MAVTDQRFAGRGFALAEVQLIREIVEKARGPGEAVAPVHDAQGVARPERRWHERQLETVFGTVEVGRVGYGRAGEDSLHPLDGQLNLPPECYSLEVRRRAAQEGRRGRSMRRGGRSSATPAPRSPSASWSSW